MITESGYSKDQSIMPEAIAVTFGRDMMNEQGGPGMFLKFFNEIMSDPESWWMHKMKNKPKIEVATVYIIVLNRLYGKVNFGWQENQKTVGGTADGNDKEIDWARITLVGPLVRCPFKRKLKGFQGFRYCTKLF